MTLLTVLRKERSLKFLLKVWLLFFILAHVVGLTHIHSMFAMELVPTFWLPDYYEFADSEGVPSYLYHFFWAFWFFLALASIPCRFVALFAARIKPFPQRCAKLSILFGLLAVVSNPLAEQAERSNERRYHNRIDDIRYDVTRKAIVATLTSSQSHRQVEYPQERGFDPHLSPRRKLLIKKPSAKVFLFHDPDTGKELGRLRISNKLPQSHYKLAPDGKHLVIYNYDKFYEYEDQHSIFWGSSITLVDISKYQVVCRFDLNRADGQIAWSPDSTHFVVGACDNYIGVYNGSTGDLVSVLSGTE